ncbi:MAG: hemerythrin domain-containing protein [Actinomycetota bacterium]
MTAIDTSMNTNLHSAFRREILRLRDGLRKCDLNDAKVTKGLARRYKFFSVTLHHHHQGEDTFLWPNVRPKANPQESLVLDAMEAEHGALASVLGDVDEEFKNLSVGSDKDHIAARLDELGAVLSGHAQHEEREGVPIVQKYIEEDDFKAFVRFSRDSEDASLVLPWVSDGATPSEVASTWGMIPAPVRLFVKPMLTRKYTKFTRECGV